MRKRQVSSGVTVNAVAGTHVVLLGFDLDEAQRKNCLGFAIERQDHTENNRYWLTGSKTFEATEHGVGLGGKVSSRDHPFQTFMWEDFTAKPEHDYTYTVLPLYGSPAQLREGSSLAVRISTEPEFGERQSVFFNRGAAASQEYARRFKNKKPDKCKNSEEAYAWLSRGLLEALKTFVGRAQGPKYGLYGAVYEFQLDEALAAIKAAADTGAQVKIIYDAIPGKGPVEENKKAIAKAHIAKLCIPHTQGKIMHNKFFVLTKDDKPIAVWTGSTNLTVNGVYGHSNCGHIVEDADVAAVYLDYWKELKCDHECSMDKAWSEENNPSPPDPWDKDITAIFSPRKGLSVLEWYADLANRARQGLFMTFAFGMAKEFQKVYEQKDGVLRYALMDKVGNGSTIEQARQDIRRIRALPNVIVAVGNQISTNCFERWLREMSTVTTHVRVPWIHTKYALIDPMSDNPTVISGSANFSKASTETNNENMLVIRNDPRVADIYLGEFMRLHRHYAFRETMRRAIEQGTYKQWHPEHLKPDDTWQSYYFKEGNQQYYVRRYFAGQ